MTTTPVRMRAAEAADYIRVSRSTLAKWRTRGEGPAWHHCGCQSAPNFDPVSASNFDPLERRVLTVALAPSELVGVAKTA